jgi:hypothetical protein
MVIKNVLKNTNHHGHLFKFESLKNSCCLEGIASMNVMSFNAGMIFTGEVWLAQVRVRWF